MREILFRGKAAYTNEWVYGSYFKEKNGIKLFFEVEGDPETAAQVAKQLIKEQPWGSVLYFQATVV